MEGSVVVVTEAQDPEPVVDEEEEEDGGDVEPMDEEEDEVEENVVMEEEEDDEEVEEVEEVEVPAPISLRLPPPKDKGERDPDDDASLGLGGIADASASETFLALLKLADPDISLLCVTSDGVHTAAFTGKTCTAAFVQLFLYFSDHYDKEKGLLSSEQAYRTFCVLENRDFNVRSMHMATPAYNEEYTTRLEKMKAKCDVMNRHFRDETLFVAFQDGRTGEIFSYAGDMNHVRYNATFHFFDVVLRHARECHHRERPLNYEEIYGALNDPLSADFILDKPFDAATFFSSVIATTLAQD